MHDRCVHWRWPCLLLITAACVPEPAEPMLDAGFRDAGSRDSGPRDAGDVRDGGPRDGGRDGGELVRDSGPYDGGGRDAGPTICPTDPNAECAARDDCMADIRAPSNCDGCVDYNLTLCAEGTCESPPVLGQGDIYTVVVTVDANVGVTQSFATIVMGERTAGDVLVSCDDIYAGTVDLADSCYNVLDSRGYTVPQKGDTYTVSFSGFASGQRSLFIIYGHDRLGAAGNRVGVSCTAADIPGPRGGGPFYITGDNMRRL